MSALPAPLLLLFALSAVLVVTFVAETLRQLPTDPTARRERLPLAWRAAWPVLLALGVVIRPLMSVRLFRSLQQRLARAGLDQVIAPQHMIAAQCLAACLAGLVLLFARGLGISIPGWTLPFVLTLAIDLAARVGRPTRRKPAEATALPDRSARHVGRIGPASCCRPAAGRRTPARGSVAR